VVHGSVVDYAHEVRPNQNHQYNTVLMLHKKCKADSKNKPCHFISI